MIDNQNKKVCDKCRLVLCNCAAMNIKFHPDYFQLTWDRYDFDIVFGRDDSKGNKKEITDIS